MLKYAAIYLIVMNVLGFIVMAIDKSKAKKERWRIPEKTLFLFSLLGGSIGTWAGMYAFRHKTKHWYFVVGMPAILIAQIALGIYLKTNVFASSIPEKSTKKAPVAETKVDAGEYDFTLCFAGDINLDESWATTQHLNSCPNGINDCISPELMTTMQQADIMWLNNEFTYSNGGTPKEGKAYTFKADPSRVENLKTMGVDIVGLANNHVYDYGKDAMLDTFATLEAADIPYVGAGRNLSEASSPVYMEVDGKTVAFVAASRAEKIKMTPQATDTEPGILRCYDTELFDNEIAEADAKADIVVALPHWGTEYSTELEQVQTSTAREYIDAGADVIIGAHTHCLQGFEYYKGVPIVYSLGNYWFNEKTLDTMLVTLHCYGNNDESHMEVQLTPALQKDCTTVFVSDPTAQRKLYDRLESISVNAEIDDEGKVVEKE